MNIFIIFQDNVIFILQKDIIMSVFGQTYRNSISSLGIDFQEYPLVAEKQSSYINDNFNDKHSGGKYRKR